MTEPIESFCPFGETDAYGSGCIKEEGHAGAHIVTEGDVEDDD